MVDKADLHTFFNTTIPNSGCLSQIGDFGLAPFRYLFGGLRVEIDRDDNNKKEIAKQPTLSDPKEVTTKLKTALAVLFLIAVIPTLLAVICKLFSYRSAETQENHRLVTDAIGVRTWDGYDSDEE
jgi:hypothetical protein